MADQKISQLTSLTGANTASGDLVTIVDISDTTMGASGTNKKMTLTEFQASPVSAGTANGVTYLNGSKVATAGAVLTFDGTRLGVGVATPSQRLEVSGSIGVNTSVSPGTNGAGIAIYTSDFPRLTFRNSTTGDTTSDGLQVYMVGADVTYGLLENGYQRWFTNNTERMRLDASGNLGIGTTTFGTSAVGVLSLGTGTAPTTGPADTVQLFSVDRSAGNTIPAVRCEGSGVTNAGITNTTVTNKIAIQVNGTIYYLLATTNAT
jgi:hypothetical protein